MSKSMHKKNKDEKPTTLKAINNNKKVNFQIMYLVKWLRIKYV